MKKSIATALTVAFVAIMAASISSCSTTKYKYVYVEKTKEVRADTIRQKAPDGPLGEWVNCGVCERTGHCQHCKGTGKVNKEKCAVCKGTGFCTTCNGEGGFRKPLN